MMSKISGKGPHVDSGICRCCGGTKKCRLLNADYEFEGVREVYSDIIMDCFGLLLSHLDGRVQERLICATCVVRLREARNFRRQVLRCEEAFLQMKIYDCESQEVEVIAVKKEIQSVSDDNLSCGGNSPRDKATGSDDNEKGSAVKVEHSEDSWSNDDEPLLSLQMARKKTGLVTKTKRKKSKVKKDCNTVENVKSMEVRKRKIHPLVRQELLQRRSAMVALNRQKAFERQRLLVKLRQDEQNSDKTSMIYHNVSTIIENSFVCPFKVRYNNLYCFYCRQGFSDADKLREHSANHSVKTFSINEYRTTVKIDITNINCRLCAIKIDDLESFKTHICTIHGKKLYADAPEFVLPFRLSKGAMQCVICEKEFLFFHAINQHMNEHYSNYVCETCGLGFVDQSRLIAHKPKHQTGTYPCEVCGKTFKNEAYKDLHVDRVHKKLGKVYCPKCDIRLMSYQQKLKHLVEVHGEQPLQLACSSCDKVFENRRYLNLHLRKYHLKDFRYECEYCGQKFFTRFSLKNHLPTHTGERNYKCKVCDKSYPRLKTLKEHTRIHTNDRRYRCHICGQAFIQNCSLKGHMRSQHPEYG